MRYLTLTVGLLASLQAQANVFQFFTGISYSNPAELFKIQQNEMILGGTGFNLNGKYSGSALNFNSFNYDYGSSATQNTNILPYGRIATRLNKQMVFGVDVTEPFNSNLYWGRNAVTRYASTETLITDVDISPRISIALSPTLYLGGGLNFNFLKNNETNWALPTGLTSYDTLVNRSSGFGLGYNVGAYYIINEQNFLGAVYYSAVEQDTYGTSQFNGQFNNNLHFRFHFPSTTNISYVHLFSQDWLINLQIFRTQWGINQYARYYNTAARDPLPSDFIFPVKYRDSWAYNAAIRHQFTEKLGLTFIGLIDTGPERDYLRPVNFPSDNIYFLALAADYHLNKNTSLELIYGHGYSETLINNQVILGGRTLPLTSGRIHFNVDVVDLRIKTQF